MEVVGQLIQWEQAEQISTVVYMLMGYLLVSEMMEILRLVRMGLLGAVKIQELLMSL